MASSVNQPRKTFEPPVASLREKKPFACGGNGFSQRALVVAARGSEQRHRALKARGNIDGECCRSRLTWEVGLYEQATLGNSANIDAATFRFEHALVHREEAARVDGASQFLLRPGEPVENAL